MHILENPRWQTACVFQPKYVKDQARYQKAVKVFQSLFVNSRELLLLLLPIN